MRNYVQRGDTLTVPAPREVTSGEGVVVGSIFGVANGDAAEGELVDLDTVGVFNLPKLAADAYEVGEPVFWDDAARLVTTDGTDKRIGVATEPRLAQSAEVPVRLNGTF